MVTQDKALIKGSPPDAAFELMDKADEALILREMKGELINEFVYHYKDKDGNEVYGLSKVGVDECVRYTSSHNEIIRAVECPEPQLVDGAWLFRVKAARFVIDGNGVEHKLDETWGFKRQPLVHERGKAKGKVNHFAFEQGGVKAQRNAKSSLLTTEIKVKLINEFKGQKGRVKELALGDDEGEAAATSNNKQILCRAHGSPWKISDYGPFHVLLDEQGQPIKQAKDKRKNRIVNPDYCYAIALGWTMEKMNAYLQENFANTWFRMSLNDKKVAYERFERFWKDKQAAEQPKAPSEPTDEGIPDRGAQGPDED